MSGDQARNNDVKKADLPAVVLFDWDGTLADSYAFLEGAHDRVLAVLGLPPRGEGWFFEFFGMPADLIYRIVYGERAERARELFLDYFYKHSAEATQPVRGGLKVIKWLRSRGVKTGVVTNMRPEGINRKLEEFGWVSYFDSVVGAGEAAQNKPAPDPIFLALERMGYDGDMGRVWFIGDTVTDLQAARSAGCPRLFISHGKADSLIEAEYDLLYQIQDYETFLAWLEVL